MDQCERRTRDHSVAIQGAAESFDELCLAAAELASERKYIAGVHSSGKLTTEGFGFLRTIGNECSHGAEVEKKLRS